MSILQNLRSAKGDDVRGANVVGAATRQRPAPDLSPRHPARGAAQFAPPHPRRRVVGRALALLAIAWLGLANGAAAQTIELRVSHFMPPNHTFQKELLRWADELDKASNGRLKLRIYPASQLGPIHRQFDLVKNGIADIAVSIHGATPGRYPLTEVVSLPFVSPKEGINSAITSRRLTELAPIYLADEHQGLRILWMAVTNPLMFHLAKSAYQNHPRFSRVADSLRRAASCEDHWRIGGRPAGGAARRGNRRARERHCRWRDLSLRGRAKLRFGQCRKVHTGAGGEHRDLCGRDESKKIPRIAR